MTLADIAKEGNASKYLYKMLALGYPPERSGVAADFNQMIEKLRRDIQGAKTLLNKIRKAKKEYKCKNKKKSKPENENMMPQFEKWCEFIRGVNGLNVGFDYKS